MRYQNLKSFQKHLATAAPEHLCHCYLILLSDDYERMKLLRAILPVASSFSGAESSSRQILDALTPDLFGSERVVLVDEVEKFDKKEIQILADNLPTTSYLLLGARKKVALASVVEKEGMILDLSDEKPWDRDKRIAEQLIEKVQKSGKRLASDVLPLLFEQVGIDSAALDREVEKLLCFVGDRPTIERSDVLRVSATHASSTLWQIAEEIVWNQAKIPPDPATFHALIPALRFQLQLGSKIGSLSASKAQQEEWSASLPKIWPKTLEKRQMQVEQLGFSYFQKGLRLLAEIELLSRTGSDQFTALLDFFRLKLHAR